MHGGFDEGKMVEVLTWNKIGARNRLRSATTLASAMGSIPQGEDREGFPRGRRELRNFSLGWYAKTLPPKGTENFRSATRLERSSYRRAPPGPHQRDRHDRGPSTPGGAGTTAISHRRPGEMP